jgi:hypothetical protein
VRVRGLAPRLRHGLDRLVLAKRPSALAIRAVAAEDGRDVQQLHTHIARTQLSAHAVTTAAAAAAAADKALQVVLLGAERILLLHRV